jgi:RimJ/RimL family protein N-acetyltransferase
MIAFISEHWGSPLVVVHGTTFKAADLPGFVAVHGNERVGLITYNMQDHACEIVTLDSTVEGKGVGTALIERVRAIAVDGGCKRIWLVTTNDNLHALRFYQKRGFEMVSVRRGAVEQSRKVKPEIPLVGDDGIPIRDEIELEHRLTDLDGEDGAEIRSERLLLRPFGKGDEAEIAENANDRAIWLGLRDAFPHPYTLADARDWIRLNAGQEPTVNFAITVDDHIVGGIGLMLGQDVYRRAAEVGYWVGRRHWGNGYASEALTAITGYAFGQLGLKRIHAGVFSNNRASARVLEKVGYTLESTERSSVVKDGQVLDRWIYVCLQE